MWKKIRSWVAALMVVCMMAGVMPWNVLEINAADDTKDYLFLATDRHADTSVIGNIINNMESVIGENELDYLGLGGDMVGSSNNHPSYNSSTVLSEVTGATSSLSADNVDIVAGIHDMNVTDDEGIVLPYKGGGAKIYEGKRFYVYGVEEYCISDDSNESNWSSEAQKFITWANGTDIDKSKAIIVLSHYPLHAKRDDNEGAYYWHKALNTVATGSETGTEVVRNVAFFHGHNHTVDSNEYVYNVGDTMNIQNGSSTVSDTIRYTYATAGYLNQNKKATLMTITDDSIVLEKYSTSGSATTMTSVVRVASEEVTLESISVSGTTEYTVGDELDLTVTANYSDKTTDDVTSKATFSGQDMSVAGTYTVTAAYEGKEATININVNEAEVANNTVTDETTNVTVTAPGLTDIDVAILENNETVKTAMTDVLQEGYVAYEITATGYENGDKATVTVPVPAGMDADKFVVYYVPTDGSAIEEMAGQNNGDGTYSFETNHFSTYVGGVPAEASEEGGSADDVVSGETVTVPGSSVITNNVEDVTIYKLVNTPETGKQYLIVNSNTGAGYGLDGDTSGYAVSTFTGGNNYYTTWDENTSTGEAWEAGSDVFLSTENPYLWTVGDGLTFTHDSTQLGVDYTSIIITSWYSLVFSGGDCSTWAYSNNSLKATDYSRYLSCNSSTWSVESSAGSVYFYEPVTIKKVTLTTIGTETADYSINITIDGTAAKTYTATSVVDGTTLQLGTAFTTSISGQEPSGGAYTWETTTNNSVASVDEAGLVTFTGKVGTETVKVSYTWTENGITYTVYNDITITTTAPEYTVDITKDGVSVTETVTVKGVADTSNGAKTLQLGSVVTYVDANGATQTITPTNGTITWESSDDTIATVDENGLVTFTPEGGEVVIKVEYYVDENTSKYDTITISAAKENYIIPSDGTNDFPEYPNEGAIRFDKTATAVGNFSATGIAQVELSMTGVPYTTDNAMDVVVMLDMTGSMSTDGMTAAEEATKAFVKTIVKNEDGSYNSNRVAVYAFNSGSSSPYELVTLKSISSDAELETANTAIATASDKKASGGTPFDEATEKCYNVLQNAKKDGIGNNRKQFCVFMSDGGPTAYKATYDNTNGYLDISNSGSGTSAITTYLSGYNSSTSSSWSFTLPTEYYTDLMKADGVTVYTVGLLLQNKPSNPSPYSSMTASTYDSETDSLTSIGSHYYFTSRILKQMATDESKYIDIFNVDNADNATAKFKAIASEILEAATNVVVEDKISDKYTLVLEAPNADVTAALPSGQEFYIEVVSYTLDENHERTSTYTTIEKIYLTDTDKVTTDSEGNITYIEGDTFTYDAATRMLTWKADKLTTTELAIRYFVYLDNSAGHVGEEEETAAGTYPTNDYATITYTNYLGNECQQEFPVPQLTWNGAQVSYVFYLVNSEGEPVNRAGQVVDFANATFITKVFTEAVVWNAEEGVTELNATKKADELLPSTYSLYDNTTQYQIHVYQNENGTDIYNYFVITAGNGTTKVYNTKAGTKYSTPGTYTASNVFEGFDFANTTVAFAVVWEPKLVKDVVVVDYGLPVDIDVTTNDMFDNSVSGIGKGVDAYGNIPMNTGLSETEVLKATSLDLKYGSASINGKYVRYTPDTMSFTDAETFYYESEVEHYEDSNKRTGYMYSSVTVVPATTIYYEDTTTFVTYTHGYGATDDSAAGTPGKWEIAGTENPYATQDEDRPGVSQISTELDADNIYGYDSAYTNCQTYSLGSAHKVNLNAKPSGTSWPKATFTFTGSAFDIISQTSNTTGTIAVDVVNTEDATDTYSWIVDTYYGYTYTENKEYPYIKYTFTYGTDAKWHMTSKEEVTTTELGEGESLEIPAEPEVGATFVTFEDNGTWVQTTTDDNTLYQIPVIKSPDLGYGTYTVTITPRFSNGFNHTANDNYDFYLDAIRVYNPAEKSTTAEGVYIQDGEAYPEFIELRNQLLGQDAFDTTTDSVTGAVFIDGFGTSGTISEYESYGPNNEIYLESGQSVAFKLTNEAYTTIAKEHLGIKAPNGGTAKVTVSALNDTSKVLSTTSATELYYDISDCVVWNTDNTSKVIVISNTGTDMVSITNLKITYSGNAAETTSLLMTADDAETAVTFARTRYLASVPVEEVVIPEIYEVTLSSESVKVGKSVDVTVTTSADATSVIVNDNEATQISTDEESGMITWTASLKATEAGTMNISVTAYSESGAASETVENTVTVTKSMVQQVTEWISNLFGFWK